MLGPDFGPVYHALYSDLVWLHAKWLEFRKLFAQAPEQIDLLNEVASWFFRVVEDVIWDDVLLHIARLTDEPEMHKGKYKQLTVFRLADPSLGEPLLSRVGAALEVCQKRAAFARSYRDKRLAHSDLEHAMGTAVQPVSRGSRHSVEQVLAAFVDVMNLIYAAHTGGEVAYRYFAARGDANALTFHLRVAKRAIKDHEDRGEYGPVPE